MSLPNRVTLFEVGPRDGLQNEKGLITTAQKVQLVDRLSMAGLQKIEVGSFVSPKWVPQMAGSGDVFSQISRTAGVTYAGLTPNLTGFEAALAVRADEVAVFAAASEAFSQKNINCSISESIERFKPLMSAAKQAGIPVRGYVSCVVGCPYDGDIEPSKVAWVANELVKLGCYQVSLGDTIGVGTPSKVRVMLQEVIKLIGLDKVAIHCHDTYGQALANIYAALELGVATIDSSVAGLGGCPYAAGASGNVASEDVLYMLNGLDIETGVDLTKLIQAGQYISQVLDRPSGSKVASATST